MGSNAKYEFVCESSKFAIRKYGISENVNEQKEKKTAQKTEEMRK